MEQKNIKVDFSFVAIIADKFLNEMYSCKYQVTHKGGSN